MEQELRFTVSRKVQQVINLANSRGVVAALELRNAALQVLGGSRSGKIYRKPGTRRYYRASAPGEAPAVRTGMLRMSWKTSTTTETGAHSLCIKPAIYTNLPYAPVLEDGTGRIVARPYVNRIQSEAVPKILGIYSAAFRNL